jgi:hypothetical protein
MPLVIPFGNRSELVDANLSHLAAAMGLECVRMPIRKLFSETENVRRMNAKPTCLAVNPAVIRSYCGNAELPEDVLMRVCSQFDFIFVYNLNPDLFSIRIAKLLSGNQLESIGTVKDGTHYEVCQTSSEMCGPYAGLRFGAANAQTDRVFDVCEDNSDVQELIKIDEKPLLASVRRGNAECFFLATNAIADLNADVQQDKSDDFFSQLLPVSMLLRYMFKEKCWHPSEAHATLIVDDPPLWPNYGFLSYERLLELMDAHNFHTSIAFIPHNYRRDSESVVQMFHDRPDRLSLCFHGNEHVRAEFGREDVKRLHDTLKAAIVRMERHYASTTLTCDRVMVFPQGIFSRQAMGVLGSHNFIAAVNTEWRPSDSSDRIRLEDFIQPALLTYGFPLFLRNGIEKYAPQHIAFNLFFGKPLLIGAHHDLFKDSRPLEELVDRINAYPNIRWSNLETAVNNSYLSRRAGDGTLEVRTYSSNGFIENQSLHPVRLLIDLDEASQTQREKVLLNGSHSLEAILGKEDRRVAVMMAPGSRCCFSSAESKTETGLPLPKTIPSLHAFCRRRLSEFRDNVLSKHAAFLSIAKALHRSLQSFL